MQLAYVYGVRFEIWKLAKIFLANLNLSVNFQKITRTASEILAKALKMGLFTKSELGQNEASTESGDTNKDTPGMFAS